MRDLAILAVSLALGNLVTSRYVEFNINENPFVCMNECSEEDNDPNHVH